MRNLTNTGRIFWGICLLGLSVQQFQYGDVRPVILPPAWPAFLHHQVFVYMVSLVMLAGGLAAVSGILLRATAKFVGVFFLALFVLLQAAFILFIQPNSAVHLGLWTDAIKEL